MLQQILLVLGTCFFLLRDSGRFIPLLVAVLPLRSRQMGELIGLAVDTLRTSASGQVVVAVVQLRRGGPSFWPLGLPSPLLRSAVMAALCLVPVLGAPAVRGPVAIYLPTEGAYWKTFGLAAWGLFVVRTIDNLVRPLLSGGRAQLHPLLALIGILGSAIVMGPPGLIMGRVVLVLMRGVPEMIAGERRRVPHDWVV